MNLKHSKQREAIKEFLMTRKDHPTADFVYSAVREEIPSISLGTVYRNLNLLADLGEIQRIHVEGATDRFDGNPALHYHFICRECGCVQDVEMVNNDALNQEANACFSGKIDGHIAYFFGKCEHCLSKKTE